MKIHVRYFAYFREHLGRATDEIEIEDGSDVHALWLRCTAAHPRVAGMWSSSVVAVNGTYAERDAALHDGDEVAFLPPVSGGSPRCRVVGRAIDVAMLEAEVAGARHGAIVSFVGVVRETSPGGRRVTHLEYEAFDEMAVREMERIAGQMDERWPGCSVAIEHRVGRMEIGEASVAIVVATPHRAAAFEACRFAIDRLKETVPIWKKEFFEDGSDWVGMGA